MGSIRYLQVNYSETDNQSTMQTIVREAMKIDFLLHAIPLFGTWSISRHIHIQMAGNVARLQSRSMSTQ